MSKKNDSLVEEEGTHEMETDTESEEDGEENTWDDWREEEDETGDGNDLDFLCLFCDSKFATCHSLFDHCRLTHRFDFDRLKKSLNLDFYGAVKLINFVRSQVSENRCWSCGVICQSNPDLQQHLHETVNLDPLIFQDDRYLKPFTQDDALLHTFAEDEDWDDDFTASINKEEIVSDLINIDDMSIDDDIHGEKQGVDTCGFNQNGKKDATCSSNGCLKASSSSGSAVVNDVGLRMPVDSDKTLNVSRANLVARNIKNVNEGYFGSYSSFVIHRDMISDKVRMDAYGQAILKNPSLFDGAAVMDVGCGTGILSLFAARAGASKVIAIEASEKMAAVATQIAKDNYLLLSKTGNDGTNQHSGVVEVVQGMVEELLKSAQIQPHSIDVLVSEWMGYCLLYESMLSSVLLARDRWLKPGGAMLPDTATILVAGFGRGVTSLPFWENVYGFNMSCIGKEAFQDASKIPIVDYVNDQDLVTDPTVLQKFDLVKMKADEVDFTSSIELESKIVASTNNSEESSVECYGVVLWFETGFTSRFCKEMPAVLSTSPYTPKTHWFQTILTFGEPIALSPRKFDAKVSIAGPVGKVEHPAAKLHLRISIARAAQHRCIDISLETTAIGADGQKRNWPVQMFNLT